MSQVDLLPKQDSLKPVPRILFLPHAMAESVLLNLDNIDIIFKFREASNLLGSYALGCLISVNSLYNSQDSIFLKSELLPGFEIVDMQDVYRDQVSLYRSEDYDMTADYDAMVKHIETAKFRDLKLPENYLRGNSANNNMEDAENNAQYYVPVLFSLRDGIYGVRLVAVTDLQSEKQIAVANLELLSKTYPLSTFASLEYFKHCIELC